MSSYALWLCVIVGLSLIMCGQAAEFRVRVTFQDKCHRALEKNCRERRRVEGLAYLGCMSDASYKKTICDNIGKHGWSKAWMRDGRS
ncbi:uncharacterized protein LOC107982147 isoform X2 [Nasonia vitripennis]|uniref:Uncharacterized protein n=1 Tax=Nasonia vitripennis TaxID=7425 RepID=A0A7M7J4I9_NASVI|nr:uncharacterized protein LOC107982147 isoform X2 [Nasonia vitripennis]